MITWIVNVLKNPIYWLSILTISVMGVIYVEFFYDSIYDKIERSQQVYICFGDKNYRFTIDDIKDSTSINAYFKLIHGETRKIYFKSSGVSNDQKFYLYESHQEYPLVRIIAFREKSTMGKAQFYEGWIWDEYLQKEPCNP